MASFILVGPPTSAGQEFEIGIIDIFGLNLVPATQVRQTLTFKEGDRISLGGDARPAFLVESEKRLSTLPNVVRAHIHSTCCDQGRAILFVGIQEDEASVIRVRAAPRGAARLAADVVRAGDEFSKALMAAVQHGDAGEDQSQGHALAHDPAVRAIQERFVGYAARDLPELRRVLRESSEASHRALAAQILGYVADKQTVVEDLVFGMSDPSDEVRNSAMRSLLVFAEVVPTERRPVLRIPPEPFIAFLKSPAWTDRNKASGALMALSNGRDPVLLGKLRMEAMMPLVEMARWKSEGHAVAAFIILGRIAGWSEDAIQRAWKRGERAVVIDAALNR